MDSLSPSPVEVQLLLCDAAQVSDGKLFVLGGGLIAIGPRPAPLAVALHLLVPWDRANISHRWRLDLLDEDGHPVGDSERPVHVAGTFEAGRPAGLRPGTPLSVPLAINFPTLPLRPGSSYRWQLSIDDVTREGWSAGFHVRAPAGDAVGGDGS